jgi:hypothetical protein
MTARRLALALALVLAVAPSTALALSGSSSLSGTWNKLPAAPIAPDWGSGTSVWTGTQMLVFGRDQRTALDARGNPYSIGSVNVAAAYNPSSKIWVGLTPPAGPKDTPGHATAVWTGKEMLVWQQGDYEAFNPVTDRWRRLPKAPTAAGFVVWTGREMIGWGGGCCGDAFYDGSAYNPSTNKWRKLSRSPLAGSQHPLGAWTGRELIILVGALNPDGKPWPARLARAAAYNPATNKWRRIASLPASFDGANAVWDGRELLVVGAKAGFAYSPAKNRWRQLRPTTSGHAGASAVWTGKRLLLLGGVRNGLAYDPKADRWSTLPTAPLPSRLVPTAVWTGRSLLVWGGVSTKTWGKFLAAGAVFTPTAP